MFLFSVIVLIASCSGGVAFNGDHKKDDGNKKKSDSDKDSGDETANDPTMVGGAYLACTFLNEQAPAGTRYIGCAINDAKTGDKRSLTNYKTDWIITENGQPVVVESADGNDSAPYHKKYSYQNDAFVKQSLAVSITASSGKSYSYQKGLNRLDSSLRDAPGKVGAVSLASLNYIGRVQVNAPEAPVSCAVNDSYCSGVQIAQIVAQSKGYCSNGGLNKDSLTLLGLNVAEYSSPQAFTFGADAVCVVKDRQNNIVPTIDGGCYIIPVRDTSNLVSMRVVSQTNAPLNSAQVDAAIAPHICLN